MNSVLFRETGKFDAAGRPVKEPTFLTRRHTANKSIYVKGDAELGLDLSSRYNAAGDSPDNATGYQIAMDTLTYIKQQTVKQSFYELGQEGLTPRSFVPVVVGEGAWAQNILTRRQYTSGGDFESGLIRQGSHDNRFASAQPSMDSVTYPTFLWADSIDYNLMEVEQALLGSQWDVIMAKHTARAKMFQLGMQELAFLGTKSGNMEGLFINSGFPINTSFITAYINSLDAAGFKTFVAGLISAYWTSTNSTRLPTHFVIPMVDWLGLQVLVPGSAGTFPTPMLTYLMNAFKELCGPNFKIIGNAYADKTIANTRRAYNKNTYALYRWDPESFRIDVPVDFTVTPPGTYDNFHFIDTGYAQITGLQIFKPLEGLLFTF